MTGRITSLLNPAQILLRVQSNRRTTALKEVAHLLNPHADVVNFNGFYEELLARDRLDTTCLGNGIALPHARTEHVKKIVMAVGRSDHEIPFDANGEAVRLFFVLGTPKTKPGDYLAVAVDYVEDGSWNDPEYLESLRRFSQRITLADAAGFTLTLADEDLACP